MGKLFATIGIFAALLSFGLLITYGIGSLFDTVMGTTALPIFLLAGGTLGMTSTSALLAKEPNQGLFLFNAICYPIMGVIGVVAVSFIFPNSTTDFLQMVSYEGTIYTFALAGAAMMAVVNTVMGVVLRTFATAMSR